MRSVKSPAVLLLVTVLVACGGSGSQGNRAGAADEVTLAAFNALEDQVADLADALTALVVRVTALEGAEDPGLPTLVDANGRTLGQVIGASPDGAISTVLPSGHLVAFRSNQPGDAGAWDALFWTSLDCSGVPYVAADDSYNAAQAAAIYPVANSWTRTTDLQAYRMATRATSFSVLAPTAGSTRSAGGSCVTVGDLSTVGPLGRLVEVDPIEAATPYRVELP